MKEDSAKYITMWRSQMEFLQTINGDTPQDVYNQALSLCEDIHKHLSCCVDSDEYILFLTLYADIISLHEEIPAKEIDIQEEIVEINRKRTNANRGLYLKKLSNSLCYAGNLHRKATQVHRAMEYMEEHLACERDIANEQPNTPPENLVIAMYRLADTYAQFSRNILAEEIYMEAIIQLHSLTDEHGCDEERLNMMKGEILIEFANFYINTRMVDNALDRYLQAIEAFMPYTNTNKNALEQVQYLYGHLSNIYASLGNNSRAEYYKSMID